MGLQKWSDLRGTLNGDYTRDQYNLAMTNAINAIRSNAPQDSNLKNKEIKALAQKRVIDSWSRPSLENTPKPVPNDPAAWQKTAAYATKPPMTFARPDPNWKPGQPSTWYFGYAVPSTPKNNVLSNTENTPTTLKEDNLPPKVFGNYTQTDLDKMSFNDAFGAARAAGQKTFYWRVGQNPKNKSGWYGTKLKSEVTPLNNESGIHSKFDSKFDSSSGYKFYTNGEIVTYDTPEQQKRMDAGFTQDLEDHDIYIYNGERFYKTPSGVYYPLTGVFTSPKDSNWKKYINDIVTKALTDNSKPASNYGGSSSRYGGTKGASGVARGGGR